MSEDRLERALHEMRAEDVDAHQIEDARARVWEKVANPGSAVCAELRPEFRAYLGNELGASRRLLVKTISVGAGSRARLAERKGERTSFPGPAVARVGRGSYPSRWVRRGMLPRPRGALIVMYVDARQ